MVNEFKQAITTSISIKCECTKRSRYEDFDAEEGEPLQEQNSEEELVFDHVSYMQQLHFFCWGQGMTFRNIFSFSRCHSY